MRNISWMGGHRNRYRAVKTRFRPSRRYKKIVRKARVNNSEDETADKERSN